MAMTESQVLFLDGPLAGQWLDYAKVGSNYVYVEASFAEVTLASDPRDYFREPPVEHVYHSYVTSEITVFDHLLFVAHRGDKESLKAGLLKYLVPPDVRAKLQPKEL